MFSKPDRSPLFTETEVSPVKPEEYAESILRKENFQLKADLKAMNERVEMFAHEPATVNETGKFLKSPFSSLENQHLARNYQGVIEEEEVLKVSPYHSRNKHSVGSSSELKLNFEGMQKPIVYHKKGGSVFSGERGKNYVNVQMKNEGRFGKGNENSRGSTTMMESSQRSSVSTSNLRGSKR